MASREEKLATFADPSIVSSHSLNIIEGWIDSQQRLQAQRGKISFHNLPRFLDGTSSPIVPQTHSSRRRFRIISFPRLENGRLKLGFPQPTYHQIRQSWCLHDLTLEAFLNNNGILSSLETQDTTCILMKVAASRSTGFDTVSISHHRAANLTNVLYYSLENEDGVFDALLQHPERCLQPSFFAAVLYRCHQQRIERFRVILDDEIVGVERGSKFGGPGRLFGHRYRHEEPVVEMQGDSMTKKLSYVQTELAVLGHLARSSLEMGGWLVEMARQEREGGLDTDASAVTEEKGEKELGMRMSENVRKTLDEAEYVRRRAATVVSQIQAVNDRVQSQTTFLLNSSLHNQTDYTAAIALETKKDSSAMKAIAALTIVFLPGTFVATVFSMNIFDWSGGEGAEPRMSKYIYVYWIVTIPLTLLVMFAWWVWLRRDLGRFRNVRSLSDLRTMEKNV
ncbi:hypothetical protein P152DRAFT_455421 [Eremomyces bilateralis CBS 781.70]|uniref:Uncharacterized protein n=1 Tax=Eremomyces bilateralis CBS 781.70 TaxID=1392243 RepID=A0A6G1GC82_9PEZI|nr:uncharacterized protein P152DRAFT_455421 [Eremomyces bilateralis CBS 781.70]KAF1815705.1 hypothetical protein P152DRAFT_455421 [Eremomyces bilateralis CBS 781.70]